eukprot:CAMPEP_0202920432 /NCGR_PEP_ID=MMETSP1392-20130828/76854_1 /ASSEMBLY_ACC=CAM_ASM_000868 /TAXON_ID=225041 /ORGANISM="Chlamydomonas chlamydogama, Strain SAG 11-48b" /LENGTH=678 /DNA_ID=CAMNT_0049613927 /DNA_START=212 /DNA_END=2249 /DNA_ORIENTATION=-
MVWAMRYAEVPSQLQLDVSSFQADAIARQGVHSVPGQLCNFNTVESFKNCDKTHILQREGARIWSDIISGAAEERPELLSRFVLLSHGDLKHYVFHYWFGFPALKPPAPIIAAAPRSLASALQEEAALVASACDEWLRPGQVSNAPFWLLAPPAGGESSWRALPLSAWQQLSSGTGGSAGAAGRVLLAASDPSNMPGVPGWPLRNLLLLVATRWHLEQVQVLCVRESRTGRVDPESSFLMEVQLPDIPEAWRSQSDAAGPEAVGWQANAQGKLLPKVMDLGPVMSPHQLAEQAVDLNLRLMRWRAAPSLDTARMSGTKCLLLGAGTLGCAVARTLLAWGVRHITFVDSSTVSFSNPVRQSLYSFNDCLNGGRPKAVAASEALEAIFPSVVSEGVELSIPMPGHPPVTEQQADIMRQELARLDALVSSHDAVFLLTDTRESRWLPAVLAAAHGKVAVTSAVGFDTFLVMRHGGPPPCDADGRSQDASHRLGCYFCNDVVAPVNSTRDRTLDQQCTVARPGLAPVAGALAVELLAAVVQHPQGVNAPPPSSDTNPDASPLGPVPHMIRGQLSGFSQVCMEGRAFSQCTACSAAVVQQYKEHGWDFIHSVIKSPAALEQLTGLAQLQEEAAARWAEDEDEEAQGVEKTGAVQKQEGEGSAGAPPGDEGGGGSGGDEDWTEL